jgi:hypothetical protein
VSTRLRRIGAVGAATALTVLLGAAPSSATELEDYLEGAASAEYSGRRIIITMWDGESQAGIFGVTHMSDMTVIGTGEDGSLVGSGKVAAGSNDAVMVPEWSRYVANDRYTNTAPLTTIRLGRVAELIEVVEDGVVRARFTFDALTKVPLATEIYDGGGRLFRYSAMLEFDPKPQLSYADMESIGDVYDVMLPVEVSSLPHDAAGYVRADTYAGPDETIHAFFTDGLFSFSLFEVDVAARLDRFEDAGAVLLNGTSYRRLVTPTEIWVTWKAGDVAYVLAGDLPPDHLEEVVADLPAPREPSLLSRLWNGIFG